MGIKESSRSLYKDTPGTLTSRTQIAIEEIRDGDLVLEIGVAFGEFAKNVSHFRSIKYYAVDVAEFALNDIKQLTIDRQLADISNERLKFTENQFNVVVCLEVFEHLQNPYHALLEIQRVLKPGGKLIVSVPNYQGGHLMIYPGLITAGFFKQFLRQNFFKVIKVKMWGPVWNKDNVGEILKVGIPNQFIAVGALRLVQIMIRIMQYATRLLGLKWASLYWCYCFVCENRKDIMGKPLWYKQLEQTSDLKQCRGWYHSYYHKKA